MEELLHRYRLALALIPDPDAAGDLFMASTSEADLRRRAARWRERRGLPPVDADPPLPELDPLEREHALHLARRGEAQRRLRAGLTAVTLVAGLAAGGFLLREVLTPWLDSHPAFAGKPVATNRAAADLTLAVYQVDVEPVEGAIQEALISVWWELSGPGAAALSLQPEFSTLRPWGPRRLIWVAAEGTDRYASRRDRLLAVSRFRVVLSPEVSAGIFRLRQGPETEAALAVFLRFSRPELPG